MIQLWETLQSVAAENGLVGLGVGQVDPFLDVQAEMERRQAEGLSGKLRFTYTDPSVSTDIRASFLACLIHFRSRHGLAPCDLGHHASAPFILRPRATILVEAFTVRNPPVGRS